MTRVNRETAVEATAWFSVLARAMSLPNQREAREARRELRRLGVRVQFDRQQPQAGQEVKR